MNRQGRWVINAEEEKNEGPFVLLRASSGLPSTPGAAGPTLHRRILSQNAPIHVRATEPHRNPSQASGIHCVEWMDESDGG